MSAHTRTLAYWYIEELMLPQEISEPGDTRWPHRVKGEGRNRKGYKNGIRGSYEEVFSFIEQKISENVEKDRIREEFPEKDDGYRWFFTFYGGLYPIRNIQNAIKDIANPSTFEFGDYEEAPPSKLGASYVLFLGPRGNYVKGSLDISSAPWIIKKITERKWADALKSPYGFESGKNTLKIGMDRQDGQIEGEGFRGTIRRAEKLVFEMVGEYLLENGSGRKDVCQVTVSYRKMGEEDREGERGNGDVFLNSFYLPDLFRLFELSDKSGTDGALRSYLSTSKSEKRVDIRNIPLDELYSYLDPELTPPGSWPIPGRYPLVFSQQLAINTILSRISPHAGKGGIYSVNGPPGTGKTTMLREIVANVIVQRAIIISNLKNPGDGFGGMTEVWKRRDGTSRRIRPIDPSLTGFEMVVASSNNGAVENITLEIPSIGSVDSSLVDELEYFSEIGSELIGGDAWGMIAAKLGNSRNKSEFLGKFIFDKKEKREVRDEETGETRIQDVIVRMGLPSLLGSEAKKTDPKRMFEETKELFLKSLEKVEDFKRRFRRAIDLQLEEERNSKEKRGDLLKAEKELSGIRQKLSFVCKKMKELELRRDEAANLLAEAQQHLSLLKEEEELVKTEFDLMESRLRRVETDIKRSRGLFRSIFRLFAKEKNADGERLLVERASLEDKIIHLHEKKMECFRKRKEASQKIAGIQKSLKENEEGIRDLALKQTGIKKEEEELSLRVDRLRKEVLEHDKRLDEVRKELRERYSYMVEDEEERELGSPLAALPEFQEARIRVFVYAMALHKAFLLCNENAIRGNLYALLDLLQSHPIQGGHCTSLPFQEAVAKVWSATFLCVPVISTTFASLPRLFSHLWEKQLGWLLIDEAGQGSAKVAAGAIKRFSGVIVVGDPLQLEPIVGLSPGTQEVIRQGVGAPESVRSDACSIQVLSDMGQDIGTYIEAENSEDRMWVGSPLRVHRRCSSPMFEISNETTYRGLMINGKIRGDSSGEKPGTKSSWIDVRSEDNEGHWIPEEGAAARFLLRDLIEESGIPPEEIYLISPFRDVVDGLKNCLLDYREKGVKIGTIHTTQGKEAKAVIMVLGGEPGKDGPRKWASRKPNLLNVACTRAKEYFFIIGNYQGWSGQNHFCVAAKYLPKKSWDRGGFLKLR